MATTRRARAVRLNLIQNTQDAALIAIGVLLASIGLKGFLLPNGFLDGGVTGISLLVNRLTGWSFSVLLIVINAPFILLAYKQLSKGFTIKTIAAIIGLAEKREIAPGVFQVSHLGAKELNEAMLAADMVLSRSGYTTLMDLAKLNKKAILIPTPGQSEQEYLGKYLMEKGYFYSLPQHQFNLQKALEAVKTFPFTTFQHGQDMEAYKNVVQNFAKTL